MPAKVVFSLLPFSCEPCPRSRRNRWTTQVLEVRRCLAGTPAFSVLETGDIILTVDGKLVTNFRVSHATQRRCRSDGCRWHL